MKTNKHLGQILSENEMKEIKGGKVNQDENPDELNFCIACGERLGDTLTYNKTKGIYYVMCAYCGTQNIINN
ncbi:MAG: hypothetical protein IJ511_10435 [Bacteroides sp.]|nr:hypothetical protein [Bacteroides sp.]